jgi:hypothetical protein
MTDFIQINISYDDCAICLEAMPILYPLDNHGIENLLCGHIFHKKCINLLREYSVYGENVIECPLCRTISYYPSNVTTRSMKKLDWKLISLYVIYTSAFFLLISMTLFFLLR